MPLRTPWYDLAQPVRDAILFGTGETEIAFTYKDGVRSYTVTKPFEGVIRNLQRRWQETDSAWVREEMARYQAEKPCATCHGARLKPEALAVKIAGRNIAEASELAIRPAQAWFATVATSLTPQRQEIARRILREINERLGFLIDVGLDYLTLDARLGRRLSGGEGQRIRLATPDRLRAHGRALRAGRALASACTSGTTQKLLETLRRCKTSATPCWWWSTTRRRYCGRPRDRHGAGRRGARRLRGGRRAPLRR